MILPCLNEAAAIAGVIGGFRTALPEAQIFVIDNGSTDGTADVARASGAEVLLEPRRGKGNAVRRAFTGIDADVYVMADGDGTYDASQAPRLIDLMTRERLDMVVGTRRKTTDAAYRAGHEGGNRFFNRVLKMLFGSEFKDIFSGYRIFSDRYVKSFPALSDGFEIETEMTIHAILLRMPVAEVESDYGARPAGSASKLNKYRDGLRILLTIGRLVRQHKPLAYFSTAALGFLLVGLVLFYPVFVEYLETGLVPRIPTLVVSIGFMVIAALSLVCGFILDTTTRTQLEIRRLIYLNVARIPPRAAKEG